MVDITVLKKLERAFPNGFVNMQGEFIANKRTNLYFNLFNCDNEFDVKCKMLEWFSRDAFKAMPYRSEYHNQKYHEWVLKGINVFFDKLFTEQDIEDIYCKLGNCINRELTVKFIKSGYDMALLQD